MINIMILYFHDQCPFLHFSFDYTKHNRLSVDKILTSKTAVATANLVFRDIKSHSKGNNISISYFYKYHEHSKYTAKQQFIVYHGICISYEILNCCYLMRNTHRIHIKKQKKVIHKCTIRFGNAGC